MRKTYPSCTVFTRNYTGNGLELNQAVAVKGRTLTVKVMARPFGRFWYRVYNKVFLAFKA